MNKNSSISFLKHLPSLNRMKEKCDPNSLIICDRRLKKNLPWNSSSIYFLPAGEKLKDLSSFPNHVKRILQFISHKKISPSSFTAIGGGSMTDFVGFFSSIYKRGMPTYFVPTTLLSALDASHGGKTALNVGSVKNVLGTYLFPQKIFIVKNLIQTVKDSEVFSAYGELLKISFIHKNKLYKELKKMKPPTFDLLWSLIKEAVKSKYRIIHQDPFEKKGIRRILNFGHTLGHCIEAYHKIPHGKAVAMGMLFSIDWSVHKKLLDLKTSAEMKRMIHHYTRIKKMKSIPSRSLQKLLEMDKKVVSSKKIEFIFLKGIGQPVIQKVSIKDILNFAK